MLHDMPVSQIRSPIPGRVRIACWLPLLAATALLGGCFGGYHTPGAAFRLEGGPPAGTVVGGALLEVPAHLALARVQGAGYRSYSAQARGQGPYSVLVPPADAETLAALGRWPGVSEVTAIESAVLPASLESLDDLRFAAAKLGADVLLLYSIATTFEVDGKAVPAAAVLKPGKAPDAARLYAEASGQFIDVRSGLVNATVSGSAALEDLATSWSSAEALDARRLEAERAALQKLLEDAQQRWTALAARAP